MKNKTSKSELKEKSDLLKEYMSMIPVGYTFENETTKKVFAVLYYYYVHNGKSPFTIGIRTIAEEAMVPRMTTNRNINLLIDRYNYIECEKGHRNVNSTYNILPCPTECPNQCPTLIKNDMGQEELVGQQNGTAKMIHSGTGNIIDNEIVTDVELDEVGQSQCDNGDFDDLGHKYKLKYKLNNNNNNLKSRNTNNSKNTNSNMEKEIKEKGSLLEEKLLERIEAMESNQEKMATLLERLMEKSAVLTSSNFDEVEDLKIKVSQLEETISLLTSRLDNASRLFAEMKKNINSSSLTNSSSHQESASSSFDEKLFEYNKAIREFYDLKDIDLKKASEQLDILNSLYEKLPQEKQAKIDYARKVYKTLTSNSQDKNALPQTPSRFKELQSKFYDTIQEEVSLERNTSLIEIFKTLQSLKLTDLEQANMDKISDAFAKELSKSESLQKHFRINLINLNTKWKTAKQDGDWNQVLALAQAYQKEFLSFDRLPKSVLTALGVKDRLDLYKKDLKNNSHFFFHPILDYLREHSENQAATQQIYEKVANER